MVMLSMKDANDANKRAVAEALRVLSALRPKNGGDARSRMFAGEDSEVGRGP